MWKQFFYFNKSQRIGILVLIALILLAFLATIFMPFLVKEREMESGADFLREAEEFKAGLIEKERKQKREREFYPFQYRTYPRAKPYETKYELFAFNPNTADSATFVKLGLRPYVARNILKYRAKGGSFRNAESFSRIYGISPEKFEELKPYIQIPVAEEVQKPTEEEPVVEPLDDAKPSRQVPYKTDDIVELNSADTALLKQIRGIGTVFARRIVGYRKILGGYYSVEQLKEVYGMSDETYEKASPYISIDESQIIKINVNKASIEKLKRHPYIKTFQRAKAIYEYRRKKIKLENIRQLKHLEEFTEEDWVKLEPYLSFE